MIMIVVMMVTMMTTATIQEWNVYRTRKGGCNQKTTPTSKFIISPRIEKGECRHKAKAMLSKSMPKQK